MVFGFTAFTVPSSISPWSRYSPRSAPTLVRRLPRLPRRPESPHAPPTDA